MAEGTRILLVDQDSLVRRELQRILTEQRPGAQFGEAANAQEAWDLVWNQTWDVVLLNVALLDYGGLEMLKDLQRSHPELPVIVMSRRAEEQLAIDWLQLGASGCLWEDSASHQLSEAIDAALRR